MIGTLGVIDACALGHSSLGWSLERLASSRIHGQNVISWIASRVVQTQQIDHVVIAAPARQRDCVVRLAPTYADVFCSSEGHVLQTLIDVTARFPAQAVVRVSIENLLVDPGLIDHLISVARCQPDVGWT